MAETKVDKVAEKVERRDIRRNFSNQIISYGLPEDGKLKYGYKRLPAQSVVYSAESYDKSIDRLSTELISNVGDLRIIEQTLNYVQFLTPSGEAEFEDTFSGRYAITDAAAEVPGGGKSWTGYKDHHYINPYSAPEDVAQNHKDNFKHSGYRTIPFDKAEEGPGLENGGYVITQELKDSGKSLKLTAIIGVANELPGESLVDGGVAKEQFKFKFNRIRKPYEPNISDTLGNARFESVWRGSYPFIKVEFDVLNSKMQVGDIWELQGQVVTNSKGCYLYGNKSIFKVDAIDTPLVPTTTKKLSDNLDGLLATLTVDDTQQSSTDEILVTDDTPNMGVFLSTSGSPSGAGNTTSNDPRSGAGSPSIPSRNDNARRVINTARQASNIINSVREGASIPGTARRVINTAQQASSSARNIINAAREGSSIGDRARRAINAARKEASSFRGRVRGVFRRGRRR